MARSIFSKALCIVLLLVLTVSMLPVTALAADDPVVDAKLVQLKQLFPSGSYFSANGSACTHASSTICSNCQLSKVIASRYPAFSNVGLNDAWTCVAFARFAYYYLFGLNSYNLSSNSKKVSLTNAKLGDFVRVNGTAHSAIYLWQDASYVYLYDSNGDISGAKTNRVNYATRYPKSSYTWEVWHPNNYPGPTQPIQPSSPLTISLRSTSDITQTNARINGTINNPGGYRVTSAGFYLGTASGAYYTSRTESANLTLSSISIWYDMNEWVGVLSSNTRYYYKFFVVAGGQTYYSAESSFMTLPVKATGVALNKSTATITTGASTTLTASISPSHASNKAVTWSSSNNKIATVTSQGVVKGVTAGTATITATAQDGSGVWARCTVTVRPAAPAAPKNPKAASVGYRKIKVSWAKTAGATGYEVYRATGSGGKYSRVKTITSGNTLSYTNAGLTSGKTYYYKVRAYRTVNGKKEYGVFSSAVSARPIPVKVKSPKAASVGYRKIKVSWAKTAGATGYEVYRATSSGGKYSRVKTITSGNTLSYTNTGLTSGKTYYYKVRAYRTVNGKKVYGVFSSAVSARPIPVKVKNPKAASVGYRKIKVSWAKTAGATGYEVYRATSSGGKYSRVKTITSGNTLSYTNAGLTSGKTYYYKVRAYRAVSGKKVYGVFSNISKARPR